MSHAIYYHRYDLFLPQIIDRALRIYHEPANGYADDSRTRQLNKVDVLKNSILDEQQLELIGESLPLVVIDPGSAYYPQLLSLRLSNEPPAKAQFILDHHLAQYFQESDESRDRFLKLVEFSLVENVHGWSMPETDQRMRFITEWLQLRKRGDKTQSNPEAEDERFYYWPHPADKLRLLYEYLLRNGLIAENPGFMDSFRDFKVDPDNVTRWLGEQKMLLGLFYKLNRYRKDYYAEPLHRVVIKLFKNTPEKPFIERSLSQALTNSSYDFEHSKGLDARTMELFRFIDSLKLYPSS